MGEGGGPIPTIFSCELYEFVKKLIELDSFLPNPVTELIANFEFDKIENKKKVIITKC